ncbi:MAG: glycoside hydrolase family 2 protein [Peptostreptococcaceae bacterium]
MFRGEYPRPQFERKEWLNLNGIWQFDFDDENRGLLNNWISNEKELKRRIQVPFAFQTELSGINETGFHDIVWYKKEIEIPKDWNNKKIILNFGAVDYRCSLYINEKYIGNHEGGHTSFSFEITEALNWDKEIITLRVEDPSTDETIPRGKQFWEEGSKSIWYTRTTGIWQTVWIEPVDECKIDNVKFTTDIENAEVNMDFNLSDECIGKNLNITIMFKDKLVAKDSIFILERSFSRSINLYKNKIFNGNFHGNPGWLWTPEHPNLFDVKFSISDEDKVYDEVESYFGMRKVHTENKMIYLNNRPYYQKLVLDQGYWPEGLLTAPNDEDFKVDILLAKDMGFNGCRKHQKVEDPRFLYWADKLGFIVWGECAANISYDNKAAERLTKEWFEIIERDYNHPSIITWVPINESWGVEHIRSNKQQQSHSMAMYYLIHSLDSTRLVISNDGWEMTHSDICAIHNSNHGANNEVEKYEMYKHQLSSEEELLNSKAANRNVYANGYYYRNEPILLTEFGGIAYKINNDSGWGYTSVNNENDFINDYERILKAIYSSKSLHGYCYTQLTDVEQEINGLLTYDRKPKCDLSKIKKINDMWHLDVVQE